MSASIPPTKVIRSETFYFTNISTTVLNNDGTSPNTSMKLAAKSMLKRGDGIAPFKTFGSTSSIVLRKGKCEEKSCNCIAKVIKINDTCIALYTSINNHNDVHVAKKYPTLSDDNKLFISQNKTQSSSIITQKMIQIDKQSIPSSDYTTIHKKVENYKRELNRSSKDANYITWNKEIARMALDKASVSISNLINNYNAITTESKDNFMRNIIVLKHDMTEGNDDWTHIIFTTPRALRLLHSGKISCLWGNSRVRTT